MNRISKINVKTRLAIVLFLYLGILTFLSLNLQAQTIATNAAKSLKDTLSKPILKDSMRIKTDTLKISKDSIDAPIKYNAEDSGVLIISTREFFLYGKAKVDYTDLKLDAATIKYDQRSQMVQAYGSKDSSGNPASKPQFIQGEMKSISDTIFYNMKSGKGLTKNTFFQEGEIYVNAIDLKKISGTEVYAKRARFTTCNLDVPHYNFRTSKMKIINNKMGIAGPSFPEFEGVPMPIGIPFGIFPLNKGRHGGLLPPAFTASPDFGLGLEGLGYYFVLSEKMDVTLRSNLYSFGGWNLNINSKYIKRYAYTGNLNITFQNTKSLNRSTLSKDEFNSSRSFMINWSHNRDSRARPGTNFSANVNFGSSRFNQTLLNNPFVNFQNQLSSSISYSKDWKGKYNLSVNLNHNQNNNLRLVNMNLPTVNFNVVTFYPFQSKDQVGSGKWYEKIGIGYSGNFQNQISFYDTAFSIRRILDTLQYGAQHSIPITLSLPSLGPITIAPSVSYSERWYGQRNFRSWNNTTNKVDTVIQRGFYAARQMSFGIAANTRIFGTYKFKPTSNIVAIRHEIRPTISVNYQPDMNAKYYYNLKVDTSNRTLRVSQFDGGILGAFGEGAFGGIGFGIDNLLEMKTKNKQDTADKAGKKIKLIDGFGFNSNYNFLADSFQLGNFNFYARSTLFEKVNITASANLDPYDIDNRGFRSKQILWDPAKFKFGRITSGNVAISTSFRSKSKDGKEEKDKEIPVDPFMTPDEQQRQLQFARANPAEFTDFNIPWNLSIAYSFNFTRVLAPDYSGFITQTFSTFNFNGDFSLTDKWKVGATGFYDITRGNLQQLSTFITREMHCWQLSINVTPIGLFRSFNITVNPKSGILRDLRINRSRTFSNF
ncbi:MAG TPA: putative LPS assembly protein LptD [Sediminibacterium sp.]|uniref:putative LPS assembly protein LptD n=1 Tax=Sediminibacterium sp. TaxID=1917865 RepID=UPI00268F7ABA|nr:putative LPS assembly protein LptD [Sediminibacterium sp.]HQS23332.1 putative LPS assembly protein LptD [Sediminibacterium sp.]HQS35925.1 putative LPS assembly protein LptD [Sediminibacterium sp.]